jgi:DNA-binding transcriptional ArsR family regulator
VYLADRERPVNDIVIAIGVDQPTVSKHLGVLRKVGLVRVRRDGRHKYYRTNADGILPLHDFASTFERYWTHQLLQVKARAEAKEESHKKSGEER